MRLDTGGGGGIRPALHEVNQDVIRQMSAHGRPSSPAWSSWRSTGIGLDEGLHPDLSARPAESTSKTLALEDSFQFLKAAEPRGAHRGPGHIQPLRHFH